MFSYANQMRGLAAILFMTFSLWGSNASAQELVPRIYWPAPNGTNVLALGYQYSSGDVVTDPTLPVENVVSKINYATLTYQRTLDLFGRSANIQINVPYAWGSTSGDVLGQFRTRDLSASGDSRILLSVNLHGAPSMDPAEFGALRANPRTIVAASILIQPPTGAYEADKLLNTGTNRWSVKFGTGLIWPIRHDWLLEVDAGVWIFGDNNDFLGETKKQDPIYSGELHLIKRIRPGFWAALDLNYYSGGETTVNQQVHGDLQRNSRIGATIVFPFKRHHAIRASYSTGISTKSGGDFDSTTLSYLYAW